MLKNKKILIPIIVILIIILAAYSFFMIYPNCKDILSEAQVICGAVNVFSSSGHMVGSIDKNNSSYLTPKTLNILIESPMSTKTLVFKDNPFFISVKTSETTENILKVRNNKFYSEKNNEIQKEYDNIPSDETLQVWIGFEKPKTFSEYEKYVYYTSYNNVKPCSTAFKSSDNPDDTAIHLRGESDAVLGNGYLYADGFSYPLDFPKSDGLNLVSKESLDFFIKFCKTDEKYFKKLLNTDLFKAVNKDIDLEKAYQYIKDNNYNIAGYSIIGTKENIDEKLKAFPDSFVVDFVNVEN